MTRLVTHNQRYELLLHQQPLPHVPDVEHTWKDGRVACKKAGRYAQVIDLVTDEVQVQENSLSVMFVSHVCGNILRVDFFVLLFLMSLL